MKVWPPQSKAAVTASYTKGSAAAHINIVTKEDKPGIDIYIAPGKIGRASCRERV